MEAPKIIELVQQPALKQAAKPVLSEFEAKIQQLVDLVKEKGLNAVAQDFQIKLTKKGTIDRRTKIGRALFAALESEPDLQKPQKKPAVKRVNAKVPASVVQTFTVKDIQAATQKVNSTIPALKKMLQSQIKTSSEESSSDSSYNPNKRAKDGDSEESWESVEK